MRKPLKILAVAAAALFAFGYCSTADAVVPSETSYVTATGNGATTVYTFTFAVTTASSDVKVFLGGVLQSSGYTVALNANQASSPGGTVTFTTAPANGIAVKIQRTVAMTQPAALTAYGPYRAKDVEKALDRLAYQAQQIHRYTTVDQDARDDGQDLALAQGAVGGNDTFITSTGSTTARKLKDRFADVVNVKDFGATGDGVTDDTAAIQAAANAAGTGNRKATVILPDGDYVTTSPVDLPDGVSLAGARQGWTNLAGTALVSGATILKNHTGAAITLGGSSQVIGNVLRDFAIRSNKTTYPTGNGITVGKGVEVQLARIAVFTVGGDGIVVGDNTTDTFHCYAEDLYVNNPGARAIVVGTKWFRGKTLRSDGGTIGLELLSGAQEFNLHNVHFEGWTSTGIKSSAGHGDVSGHNVLANTASGLYGIDVANVSGAYITKWRGFHMFGFANAAGTRGLRLNGAQNTHHQLLDSMIENAERGVEALGDSATIAGTLFYGCGRALKYNAGNLIFARNRVEATVDAASAEIVGGATIRAWGNILDKSLGLGTTQAGFLLTDAGATQAGAVYQGSGAPNNANGNNGDVYFRTDTPANQSQRIYVKTAGSWLASGPTVSADRGDTSQTITVGTDAQVQRWATALTANRTVTCSTTGAANGDQFRVVRTGLGAFTLDVCGLKTIASATAAFVDVSYDGSAWVLAGYGAL